MSTELLKNDSSLPAVGTQQTGTEDILGSAIVVPRLLIMQGLSEAVAKRQKGKGGEEIRQGDIVRSSTLEVLGNPDKPVDFIPVTFQNQWIIQEKVGNKFEYRGVEVMNASNQDADWEFMKDGTQWRRVKALNVFALLPADVAAEKVEMDKAAAGEAADPDKALLPVVISFRSTGYAAGKDVVTHFAKARKFNQNGYVSTLQLSVAQTENDKGIFYVPKVKTIGRTDAEVQKVAEYWRTTLATKAVQVQEADEDKVDAAESTARREASGRAASRF